MNTDTVTTKEFMMGYLSFGHPGRVPCGPCAECKWREHARKLKKLKRQYDGVESWYKRGMLADRIMAEIEEMEAE